MIPKNGKQLASRVFATLKSVLIFVAGAACMHAWNGQPGNGNLDRLQQKYDKRELEVADLLKKKDAEHKLKMAALREENLVGTKGQKETALLKQNDVDIELDFYSLGLTTNTDKVAALSYEKCFANPESCTRPGCVNKKCSPWGHYYQTMYQSRLGKYSKASAEPFQFLEIGFFQGAGADTYRKFLPNAEVHSLEIACIPEGSREEGKWPFGNFAAKHKDYETLRKTKRLHCGDATNVTWLNEVWTTHMKRQDAPPLKIVVDDGAHLAAHMAQSVFYWFPRIQPRGLMIVEDVQPIEEANWFRTRFLPKIMSDLHYCGDPAQPNDTMFFPTLQPRLASIHCEMHICIFERNDEPAVDLSLELSTLPKDVWNDKGLTGSWGRGDF